MPGNLQDAIAAMLTAKTAEELDGAIVGAVAEAAGFRRAALFAPPTEEAAAVVRRTHGSPAIESLPVSGTVESVAAGTDYVSAPLREQGRVVAVFYADTPHEGLDVRKASANVACALEVAGIVRDNLALRAERDHLLGELDRLARTDALTGLPNRRVLEERLADELHRSARSRHAFALVIVDIDRFQEVVDQEGQLAGNEALQRFANALRSQARQSDFVARFAGTQFSVMAIDVDAEKARTVVERMLDAIREVRLTASAGVTLSYPVDSADSIVERAEAALYQAKQAGRDRAVFG